MADSKQRNGMRGVFLTAAELSKYGYTVAPTARNSAGADLLVFTPANARAFSIDVKTNARRANFWLVGPHACERISDSFYYVFLNIVQKKDAERFDFYVVPSKVVAEKVLIQKGPKHTFWAFELKHAERFQDRWKVFGPTS